MSLHKLQDLFDLTLFRYTNSTILSLEKVFGAQLRCLQHVPGTVLLAPAGQPSSPGRSVHKPDELQPGQQHKTAEGGGGNEQQHQRTGQFNDQRVVLPSQPARGRLQPDNASLRKSSPQSLQQQQ